MPANTQKTSGRGTLISLGDQASVITANESNQLKIGSGKVAQVIVWGVGSGWVIDIYDHGSTNTNRRWQWVTADGKGVFALQVPMANGIRVVTSGTTPGSVTIIWS